MYRNRIIFFAVAMIGCTIGGINTYGLVKGFWTGSILGLGLFVLVGFFLGWADQQPQQEKEQTQSFKAIENTGELVPARRGKPDPTRPNWNDEMSGHHYERERR